MSAVNSQQFDFCCCILKFITLQCYDAVGEAVGMASGICKLASAI